MNAEPATRNDLSHKGVMNSVSNLSGNCQESSDTNGQRLTSNDLVLRRIVELWPTLSLYARYRVAEICLAAATGVSDAQSPQPD